MSLIYIYDFCNVIAGTILIAVYAWLFAFIWRGNKNTWLLVVTFMLLVSNIGTASLGLALYESANDT